MLKLLMFINHLRCSDGCSYEVYDSKYCRTCGSKTIPKEKIKCECGKKLPSRCSGGYCTYCGKDVRERWIEIQKQYN